MADFKDTPSLSEHSTNEVVPKRSFGACMKHHFKRFWWIYLIALVIVILVVILPIIFVGYPNQAQSAIDESTLDVVSMGIYNPTPEGVTISLTSVIGSHSSNHPALDALNASLFLLDTIPEIKPFVYLPVPAIPKVVDGTITHIVNATVPIVSTEQFSRYTTLSLDSDTFEVGLRGRLGLSVGSLPHINVDYNKNVKLVGLNKLDGFSVTDINIAAGEDGSNVQAIANIPNPSNMTLEIGNLLMDMYVQEELIGNATVKNLVLRPGANAYNLSSTLEQLTVVGLIQNNYTDGILPVTLHTRTVTFNGQSIDYYQKPLAASPLALNLDAGSALRKIGLNVTSS